MRSLRRPRGTSNRQPPQPTKKSWRDPVDLTARLFVARPRFGRSTHGENKKILMQSLWMSAHVSNDYRVDLSSRNALWDTSSEDRGCFRKKSHTTDHSQAHTLHKCVRNRYLRFRCFSRHEAVLECASCEQIAASQSLL